MGFWELFVLAVLATWRVTHLLAHEDGPADLIVRFRVLLGDSVAGKLLDCFYCLSLWIAAPAALFVSRRPLDWLLAWLALSGGACLLERATGERHAEREVIQSAPNSAEGDIENVLRIETLTANEPTSPEEAIERTRHPAP